MAIGALSVTTLTYAKAEGISVEGAKSDSVFIPGGKAYELDGVTVTGSRAPMAVELSPKIVTVMTREDIQRSAAQTINDVLKLATGVDVRQRGGFGVQTDISINGGTFDQIAIFLNGVNISNPQTGHNASDFPVALADIDHVEIIEGASSRVFGTSAFNGAINIVTKKSKRKRRRGKCGSRQLWQPRGTGQAADGFQKRKVGTSLFRKRRIQTLGRRHRKQRL